DLDRWRVWASILAVTELEEPPFRHGSIGTGAGTIHMHPLGLQVIHPYRMLIQGRFTGGPPCVVTKPSQHHFEPVIGKIDARDSLSGRRPQRVKPVGYPG